MDAVPVIPKEEIKTEPRDISNELQELTCNPTIKAEPNGPSLNDRGVDLGVVRTERNPEDNSWDSDVKTERLVKCEPFGGSAPASDLMIESTSSLIFYGPTEDENSLNVGGILPTQSQIDVEFVDTAVKEEATDIHLDKINSDEASAESDYDSCDMVKPVTIATGQPQRTYKRFGDSGRDGNFQQLGIDRLDSAPNGFCVNPKSAGRIQAKVCKSLDGGSVEDSRNLEMKRLPVENLGVFKVEGPGEYPVVWVNVKKEEQDEADYATDVDDEERTLMDDPDWQIDGVNDGIHLVRNINEMLSSKSMKTEEIDVMEPPREQIEKDVLTEMIEMYKSYKLLWDSSQASYFNKDARNQAFACLLNVYKRLKPEATLKDVKKKMDNLRSRYKKEVKKVKESFVTSSGSKEQYVPTLWYYEIMLFLDEKEMVRPGAETVEEEDECDTIMNDTQDHAPDEPPVETPTATLQPSNLPSDPSSTPASGSVLPNASQNIFTKNTPIPPKRAKMSLRKKQDAVIDAAQALIRGTGNQFDTFGVNVAQQLQILSPDQQAIAQKLFSDVLFLGKLGQLTPTASVLPISPASLPMPVCGPSPTVPYYHPRYSQPFERFNSQYDRFSNVSDVPSPPMSSQTSSTSSQTTPSPSPRVIPSASPGDYSKLSHAPINHEQRNITDTEYVDKFVNM